MKKLITILIMLPLFGMGQVGHDLLLSDTTGTNSTAIGAGVFEYTMTDTLYAPPPADPLVIVTNWLLKSYVEDCYNDSTEVCGWVFVQSKANGYWERLGYTPGYSEYKCWYEHKEPTLKGFIEWLDKK